jgi:hypothetical protein
MEFVDVIRRMPDGLELSFKRQVFVMTVTITEPLTKAVLAEKLFDVDMGRVFPVQFYIGLAEMIDKATVLHTARRVNRDSES